MKQYPKRYKEMFERALNALRNMAPETKFKGITLADFAAQVERSLATRRHLDDLDDQTVIGLIDRETEDEKTLAMLADIVDGVVGHEDFGDDSALYEALGFVRKSQRKSGLTRRKRKAETKEMP
ncbi:MAG: hypothetical protein JSS81_03645 [Acidobacteria bacterium]|nr:hypothetical protein [Acidobacteriota bacterium]